MSNLERDFAAVFGYLAKAHARFLLDHQDVANAAGKKMNPSGVYDETLPLADDLELYERHVPGATKLMLDLAECCQREYWDSRKAELARRPSKQYASVRRGQIFACIVLLAIVAAIIVCAANGLGGAAAAVAGMGAAGIVTNFIGRKK